MAGWAGQRVAVYGGVRHGLVRLAWLGAVRKVGKGGVRLGWNGKSRLVKAWCGTARPVTEQKTKEFFTNGFCMERGIASQG